MMLRGLAPARTLFRARAGLVGALAKPSTPLTTRLSVMPYSVLFREPTTTRRLSTGIPKGTSSVDPASASAYAAASASANTPAPTVSAGSPAFSSLSSEDDVDSPEGEIHPEWLAMERRVGFRKPTLKGEGPQGRSPRRASGWDGENV
ncbi:hypothetical protein B484DRAFT_450177 [Ochromonadaceae sp. CCMP2298]|nr:hypothetical protein B484DRAFT_450177 [Ochromonadaceae sp. CCMP2298]